MTAFDTLKYANKLKFSGVPSEQAEAQAEALFTIFENHNEHILTKNDLKILKNHSDTKFEALHKDIVSLEGRFDIKLDRSANELRYDMASVESRFDAKLDKSVTELRFDIAAMDRRNHTNTLLMEGRFNTNSTSMEARFDKLFHQLRLEIAEIKSEQKVMKWMLGIIVASNVTLIFKAFF